MNWREIPKIDAHVHIIPDDVHAANPDSDDEFSFATTLGYQKIMDQFNIQKAVIDILDRMDFSEEEMHRIGHMNAEALFAF